MRVAIIAGILLATVQSSVLAGPECLSMAGEWSFRLDPKKEGMAQEWFKTDLPQRIKLPGTTDEAKLGTPNTRPPNLLWLYRLNSYTGPAWYQRDIEIPAVWDGKRVALFLEPIP